MMEQLNELVKQVAYLRAYQAREKALESELEHLYQVTPEYRAYLDVVARRKVYAGQLKGAEEELRTLALECYDGDVPHDAIHRIVTSTEFDYQEDEALDYCCDHFRQGVTLNKKAFERLLRADVKLKFVKFRHERKVQLKSDMSAWEPELPE